MRGFFQLSVNRKTVFGSHHLSLMTKLSVFNIFDINYYQFPLSMLQRVGCLEYAPTKEGNLTELGSLVIWTVYFCI